MARGWESKSIQAQIESANAQRGIQKVRLSAEEMEKQHKRESLLLHRTRVLHDLEKCCDERYRATLSAGLSYLEAQLVELGWTRPTD
jgi:hypothetical protein